MTRQYKLKRSLHDERDYIIDVPRTKDLLPIVVDMSKEMPPVLDQGSNGSCAAHASAVILQYLLKKGPLSRLYMYYTTRVFIEKSAPSEDTGVYLRDICKAIQKYYVCDEKLWPYNINKFTEAPPLNAFKEARIKKLNYYKVPQDLVVLQTLLSQHMPILIGVLIYASFESEEAMKTGVIPLPDKKEELLGGHALALVGYNNDKKTFLVQNSWGIKVGQKGFFELPFEYLLDPELSGDFWTFSDTYVKT